MNVNLEIPIPHITGIPTFRGGSDSIWCVTAASQGRRSVFLRDPLRWYNEFWLRHFPMSFTRMTPNAGHEAIAGLATAFPGVRVITQNIDALVSGAGCVLVELFFLSSFLVD